MRLCVPDLRRELLQFQQYTFEPWRASISSMWPCKLTSMVDFFFTMGPLRSSHPDSVSPTQPFKLHFVALVLGIELRFRLFHDGVVWAQIRPYKFSDASSELTGLKNMEQKTRRSLGIGMHCTLLSPVLLWPFPVFFVTITSRAFHKFASIYSNYALPGSLLSSTVYMIRRSLTHFNWNE
jgi:hypothetical protein